MGYRTSFGLNWTNESWQPERKSANPVDVALASAIADYIEEHETMCYAFDENGDAAEPCKWYECEEDIRAMSLKFPGVLFHLSGEGEDAGDVWDMFAKDGKLQRCQAEVIRAKAPKAGGWK